MIKIISYTPAYAAAFKAINEEWITKYFKMEDSDYKALDHPQEYILDRGGAILVVLENNEVVGVCALIKMDHPEYDFELAKMGVRPHTQAKGLGYLLGQAIIEKAKELGAKTIYLETNTCLAPAIKLYFKLGFTEVKGVATPYDRCDFQMELKL
ncbi:MAG: N-acetylglutamate synthase-like GNAT family acetyltransferase [Ulvibacter sp.]